MSVPEGHKDYQKLKEIEEEFGSYFENVSSRDLWAMLHICSIAIPKGEIYAEGTLGRGKRLLNKTCFNLIPFLHQVLDERMNNAN